MSNLYSTYEAKARFSELLRKVREGQTVTISYHGEPVAELRPIEKPAGTAARLERLLDRGVLVPAEARRGRLTSVAHRPGALERFLADRNR
jgi:prevent-host-death family protein